jgi:hypothetical protein
MVQFSAFGITAMAELSGQVRAPVAGAIPRGNSIRIKFAARGALMAHGAALCFATLAMALFPGHALAASPQVRLSPSSLAFGLQVVKTTSPPQVINLTNNGPGTLTINSITITGTNRVDFAQTNNCGLSVEQGGNCQITVTFTPVIVASLSASVTVKDNGQGSPQTVPLTGTGTSVQLMPPSVNFGYEVLGDTSMPKMIQVTNVVSWTLTITKIAITGANAGDFSETSTTCGSQLNGNSSCEIFVAFAPTASGARSAMVVITDNGGGGSQNVPLSGTGIPPGPYVALSPASLTFGNQRVGTSSPAQTVTLTNVGNETLTIGSITITGTNSGDFAIPTNTNTCGTSLMPGANCTFAVVFTPTAMGFRAAAVSIADNAPGSPQTVNLNGTSPFPAPSINQPLVPQTAQPGGSAFTLTLNGTGFTSFSTVKWNRSARTTTFVSSTQLTAAILATDISIAGTATVSVSNPSPGGGNSNSAFFEVTNPVAPVSTNLASLTPLTGPRAIVWGDFNGDGIPDLAVANRDSDTVTIFLGNSNGTFRPGASFATGQDPIALATGDFNGDGKLDLVVADRASYTISILLGNGDGTFGAHVDLPAGVEPLSVAVGDFNSDGALDVVSANSADGTISIFLGNGDGTFQSQVQYMVSSSPFAVAVADFNGDGNPDLAVTDAGADTVSILLGNGDGTFQSPVSYVTGDTPLGVLAADFNGDGRPDLAVVNSQGNTVSVLLNNGDGTFKSRVDYPVGLQPFAVVAGDFTGDGRLDLAVSNTSSNTVSILAGNGDGTFQSGAQYPTSPGPEGIAAADFNGDGRLDLATANETSDNASVLLQIPVVTLVPTGLAFGPVMLSGNSSLPVTFTNSGSAALTITGISITGANSADYSQLNNCPSSNVLAGGASCTITVTFTPISIGDLTAAVMLADSAGDSPQIVGLDGVGVDPSVTLQPVSLTFAGEPIGYTSPAQTVSLTNTGNTSLTISSVAVTDTADFAQTNNCIMLSPLAAGASCAIMVTFTPSTTGTLMAAVNITDNAPGSPQSVSLSGTGDPQPMVMLAPIKLGFPNQMVDTTSLSKSVTLTNNGMGALTISRFDIQGDFLQTNDCGTTVQPNGTCTITVTFTPVQTGYRSGKVYITDDAMGSPQTFQMHGNGITPALTFSPTHYNFTEQPVGSKSPVATIVLKNTTSAVLDVRSVAITGPNGGDYSQTNNCGSSLQAGASCKIKVTFTPSALGPRVADITVMDNAGGSPQTVPLIGNGTLPAVELVPPSLTFADQIVGSNSPPNTITLYNTGDAKLKISKLTITGPNEADFIIQNTSTCGSTLAYGQNCMINVTFNPTATGMRTAFVSITDNAPGSPQTANLFGTGVAPSVVLSPTSLTFAAQQVGTTSPSQTVILNNTGSATLTITALQITGTNKSDYNIANNTCGGSVAEGANCAISVAFTPTASGARSASLSITDNAAGSPQTASLTGTGTAPAVTLFPGSLAFGNQDVGTTSAPLMVNVNNTGTAPLTVTGVGISGVNSTDFSQTNDCNVQVAPGANCMVVVTFTPTASGTRAASLSITDNAGSGSQTASLTGTGIGSGAPTASLSPNKLTFVSQNVNTTSAPQTVTLTNNGGSPLTIVSIVAAGDYAQTNNCGSSLAAGNSCMVQVTFTPSAAGTRSGYVTFSDNDPTNNGLQTVNLSGTGVVPTSTVSVSPIQASMTPGRTQQFIAYISGVQSNLVNWSVTGVTGATGTISATGLYTAPNAAGSNLITATSQANMSQSASVPVIITNYPGVFTYHNDPARTGQNENETVLTTGNVNQGQFGKLFKYAVDGDVYAQPLYVEGVTIPGQGVYNVVYVATENDSLYAFDADGIASAPLWQVSFINPSQGITPVGTADIQCTNITPVIGITGTPVVDTTPGVNAIFLVVRTKVVSNGVTTFMQELHALDLGTGQELSGSPVIITASVPGTGDGGTMVNFNPLTSNQRPGLLLLNNTIYIAWGAHCDVQPFHGWLMGYDESTLAQTAAYTVTANGAEGGIWQSGGAPAADSNGNIFVETGNGTFDAGTGGTDYGESYLKLSPSLTVEDYFTPFDWANLNDADLDVGSGGPVLLPEQTGQNPHLLVGAGKDGEVFLLDRDQMGEYSPYGNQVVQDLPPNTVPTFHAMPAYWENNLYFVGVGGTLNSFRLTNGLLSPTPVSQSLITFPYPGAVTSTSSNGSADGILWLLETGNYSSGLPDVLHAFDAANVAHELYNTSQNPSRDMAGAAVKFGVPTVANGKVYVATHTELDVYGLLP